MTTSERWSSAYLTELDRAAALLPPDRRAELLTEISDHLRTELDAVTDEDEARAVLERLGDPHAVVAEASADLPPPPAQPGSAGASGAEIASLLLIGVGGIALPLIAPAVGVLLMASTPRWTPGQVRTTWAILGVGFAALVAGLFLMALADPTSGAAVRAGLLLLGTVFVVGPAAALYAGTRPRRSA